MAQFLYPENQRILWDTMQKSPQFKQVPKDWQSSWFKTQIGNIYDQMGAEAFFSRKVSTQELDRLNQYTLRYMIQKLKEMNTSAQLPPQLAPQSQQQYPTFQGQSHPHSQAPPIGGAAPQPVFSSSYIQNQPSRPSISSNSVDSLQNHYMEKKTEMERMISKKVPDQIDFTIKEKDEPIESQNMEEMVKRYMKDRDLDIPISPQVLPDAVGAAPKAPSKPPIPPSSPINPFDGTAPTASTPSFNNISIGQTGGVGVPVPDTIHMTEVNSIILPKLDANIERRFEQLEEMMKETNRMMKLLADRITVLDQMTEVAKLPETDDMIREVALKDVENNEPREENHEPREENHEPRGENKIDSLE